MRRDGFPTDIRNKFTSLFNSVFNNSLGLWQVDVYSSGVQINNISDLELFAIWPKLYCRLFSFFNDGNNLISQFETWIRQKRDKDDELWIISKGEFGNMHDIFEISDNKIKMVVSPEDIVIVPK